MRAEPPVNNRIALGSSDSLLDRLAAHFLREVAGRLIALDPSRMTLGSRF